MTSRTGDRSSSSESSELTLELPASRCRLIRARGLNASLCPPDAACKSAGSASSTALLTDTCGETTSPGSKSWACIINLRSQGPCARMRTHSRAPVNGCRRSSPGTLGCPKGQPVSELHGSHIADVRRELRRGRTVHGDTSVRDEVVVLAYLSLLLAVHVGEMNPGSVGFGQVSIVIAGRAALRVQGLGHIDGADQLVLRHMCQLVHHHLEADPTLGQMNHV